jgi:hypothetical protein
MNFLEKFAAMGLVQISQNAFRYSDQYSSVIYEKIKTCDTNENIPLLSVWTKSPAAEKYTFQGIVSLVYNFIGNNIANARVRESIAEIKTPVFREYTNLNSRYTFMHSDLLIQNASNIPEVGDVYPHVTVRNSYDGRSGILISFGISLLRDNLRNSLSFRKVLTSFRQIHSQHSKTSFTTAVGGYVDTISSNILDFVKINFETPVAEDALLATLDLVESLGQRRRTAVSDTIQKITEGKSFVSCWDLFLAITRFSTVEKNLNAKVLLEDIVERTLVIPVKMMEMMKEINK